MNRLRLLACCVRLMTPSDHVLVLLPIELILLVNDKKVFSLTGYSGAYFYSVLVKKMFQIEDLNLKNEALSQSVTTYVKT